MLFTLLSTNLLMSIMFMFMKHPMSMGMILLMQTIMISLMSGFMSYSYWFSYILFLIMLGGMLVLFIYMTSLASNEMFSLSIKLLLLTLTFLTILLMMILIIDNATFNPMIKNSNTEVLINKIMINENTISLNKIYNSPHNIITILLINYLLLTLIATVKITSINMGPLRQKF